MLLFTNQKKTRDFIESVGCRVIFLPAYSPDLNPIEKFWAKMRRWVKNNITDVDKLYNALECFFLTAGLS